MVFCSSLSGGKGSRVTRSAQRKGQLKAAAVQFP